MGTYRILMLGCVVAVLSGFASYTISQQHQLERAQVHAKTVVEQVYLRALREYYQYLYDVRHQQQQGFLDSQTPSGAITPYLSNHVSIVDVEQWLVRQGASTSPYSALQLNITDLHGHWWPEHVLSAEIRLLITFENGQGYQQLWALHEWLHRLFGDVGINDPQFRIEALHSGLAAQTFGQPVIFTDFLLPQLQLVVDLQGIMQRYYQAPLPWLSALSAALVVMLSVMLLALFRIRQEGATQSQRLIDSSMSEPLLSAKESSLQAGLTRQERLASLGEMTSGILHEINNPLAYLHSNLTELQRDLTSLMALMAHIDKTSDSLDSHSSFYQALLAQYQALNIQNVLEDAPLRLSDCQTGVQRMQDIIDDMRRVGRMMTKMHWQSVNPNILSAINIARNKLPSNVHLNVSLIEVPVLYCNASQISQVVVNLLVNAMQALPDGGTIRLEQTLTADWLCIQVIDDGPGIDECIVARIFDPFFTTKSDSEGTGLGLSICQKIVQQHGGRIELKTTLGQGTCFTVYLPLVVANVPLEVDDAE